MTEQLVVVRNQEAADRLVDEPVEEVGLQSIAFAEALLGDVANDTTCSSVYAVPLLEHRYDDPLRLLGVIEQIVVLQAVEIPVVAHVLAKMPEDQVELDREAKCLTVLPECGGQQVVLLHPIISRHSRIAPDGPWIACILPLHTSG